MPEAIKEESKELKIVEFDEFETKLTEFKGQFEKVVYDLTDKKQEKQARSDRMAIGKVVSALDAAHKKIKAPLLDKTKLLDTERKRIKDELQGVQSCIKSQIDKHEEAIRQKAAELQARVSEIVNIGFWESDVYLNSEQLNERLKQLKSIVIDDSFEDRKGDAAIAKDEASQMLESCLEVAIKHEEEEAKAEEERLAQVEEDKKIETARIEKEAKEKAEADAQKAIDDAKRATEEAEQRAKDAEAKTALDASEKERLEKKRADEAEAETKRLAEKADKDAKQAVIDQEAAVKAAEDKVKADQIEADRLEAEALAEREADIEHRKKINNAAADAFMNLGFNEMAAQSAVKAIAKGLVPAVSINY